jgi:hypothetical protein
MSKTANGFAQRPGCSQFNGDLRAKYAGQQHMYPSIEKKKINVTKVNVSKI